MIMATYRNMIENGPGSSFMRVSCLGLKILKNFPAKKAADNRSMNINVNYTIVSSKIKQNPDINSDGIIDLLCNWMEDSAT